MFFLLRLSTSNWSLTLYIGTVPKQYHSNRRLAKGKMWVNCEGIVSPHSSSRKTQIIFYASPSTMRMLIPPPFSLFSLSCLTICEIILYIYSQNLLDSTHPYCNITISNSVDKQCCQNHCLMVPSSTLPFPKSTCNPKGS